MVAPNVEAMKDMKEKIEAPLDWPPKFNDLKGSP